jgi:hypothetical protein
MITFDVRNRWTGGVQFTAEIECAEDAPFPVKLGLAVRWAIEARAVLTGADLTDADLTDADLTDAVLTDAVLTCAVLTRAVLTRADLTDAVLTRAVLTRADLTDAVLTRAVLTRAVLTDAVGAELAIAQTRILPAGELVGWKKCADKVIVKLRIPADARRSHAFGRKCRAEFADVVEVIDGEFGLSEHDGKTQYVVGERVTCDTWCEDWMQECAGGIHFFITREEAEAY